MQGHVMLLEFVKYQYESQTFESYVMYSIFETANASPDK